MNLSDHFPKGARPGFFPPLALLLGAVAVGMICQALGTAQTSESQIVLQPPPESFMEEFPVCYRTIPPFDVSTSFNDPENAVVAARQLGYTSMTPSPFAANYDRPLVPPVSSAPPATQMSAYHPPASTDEKGADAARQFIFDRAIREDFAFDVPEGQPNRCLECFGDVFPNGYAWLKHGNKEIATVTALIDAIDGQVLRPELNPAKAYWHRHRPIASGDTRIQFLDKLALHEQSVASTQWQGSGPRPYDIYEDVQSFPSGHSTTGMLDGLVLADIAPPAYRLALLARGVAFGDDRVLLGAHYPSDVEAGRALAEKLYEGLAQDPAYRRAVAQARLEFKAALNK